MTAPLVSVLMPAHNAEDYIAAAVAGVLGQRHLDLELVVVDDGSTDGTARVLATVDDPRLRVLHRPRGGVVAALNAGLDAVRGALVARMDADDLLVGDRIARQVAFLAAHPEVVACGTDYEEFGERTGVVRMPRSPAACRARLAFGTCIAHGAAMIRRGALDGVRYRADYPYAEDFKLFSELARRGSLANLPFVGLRYRRHPTQVSSATADLQRVTTLRIVRENLGPAVAPPTDDALGRLLWWEDRGAWAAARGLVAAAPVTLRLGYRACGVAGALTAVRHVREQLNSVLRA